MPSVNPHVTALVNQYVEAYPDLPSKTLARLLVKRHPRSFRDVEDARSAIRYRRNASGKPKRTNVKTEAVQAGPTPPSRFNPINPTDLPKSFERDHTPFEMDGCRRVLILPDIHLPYHNSEALALALNTGLERECDGVLLNGDLMDMHTLSRFCKDPDARSFVQERETARLFLKTLRERFPQARIVFKEGNHDERLRIYALERAAEIYAEDILGLPQLLGLDDLGIEHVQDKREVLLGRLPVLHGHELPRGISAPVNPARGAFLRAKTSVLVSHSHKTSEHTETNLSRDIVTCWSTGCLCGLRPLYEPNNGWNHGFAEVELAEAGAYQVTNYRIHEGRLLNS